MKENAFNFNIRKVSAIIIALVGLVAFLTVIVSLSGQEATLYAAEHFYYEWKAPAEYKNLKNPLPGTEQSLAQGKKIYDTHCLKCHGPKGAGVGSSTDSLKTLPGDLSDKRRMSLYTDGTLFWKTYVGRGEMPPWQLVLSEEEIWHVVNYLRTFAAK